MSIRGQWIALDEQAQADYLEGYLTPYRVRETEHGVEVWQPHELSAGRITGAVVCRRCGLLPSDYDAIEQPCDR